MAKSAVFYHYTISEEALPLHKLVVDTMGKFLKNHPVQNVLLNHGYNPDHRPTSFYDIRDATFIRTRTMVHLIYLEHVMDVATRPRLAVAKEQGAKKVYVPGDPEPTLEFKTEEGHDFLKVEALQRGWFENPEDVKKVREMYKLLSEAFNVFNLKLILTRLEQARGCNIMEDWKGEYAFIQKIAKVFGKDGIMNDRKININHELDNLYYNVARSLFSRSSNAWTALDSSEYGKNFRLTMEEERQGLEQILGGRRIRK